MKAPRSLTRIYPHVTTCHDAKRPVEIEIKPRDVTSATKKDATACAMATAICREWKADEAVIGLSYSYVIKGKTAMRFVTPPTVQREIVSFDRAKDFRPGKYHLAPVPKSQRRKTSGPKKPRASHAAKRVTFHRETLGIRKMAEQKAKPWARVRTPPMPANPTAEVLTAKRERPDWFNLIAKERGLPDGWRWFTASNVDGVFILRGGVPGGTFSRGKHKGRHNPKLRTEVRDIAVTSQQLADFKRAWSERTGTCAECHGEGMRTVSISKTEGRKTRECPACVGTGLYPPSVECVTCLGAKRIRDGSTGDLRRCLDCGGEGTRAAAKAVR